MKIQPLYDLQQEVNRLFIAGSRFAAADPRLLKLAPVMARLGEKAPVFKRLAHHIEELTTAAPEQSAGKLLDLAVLLYSVLYTQGEATPDIPIEEWQVPRPAAGEIWTNTPFSTLNPLVLALTSSSPGRYEIIKEAYQNGVFRDLRTHVFLAEGLDDKYSELASLIGETIIPAVGPVMAPYLKERLDLKGKAADAQRLRLLHRFGHQDVPGLVGQALTDGSTPVMVAAVSILGDDAANEQLLLSLTGDKKKDVREAALVALAKLNSPSGLQKALALFTGKNYRSAIPALQQTDDPGTVQSVLGQIKKNYSDCLVAGLADKEAVEALDKLQASLQVLAGKTGAEVLAFYEMLVTSDEFYGLRKKNAAAVNGIVQDIMAMLTQTLPAAPTVFALLQHLVTDKKAVKHYHVILNTYFTIAADRYSKEEMFETFSPYYQNGQLDVRLFTIYNKSNQDYRQGDGRPAGNLPHAIDKRWLKLLISLPAKNKKGPATDALYLALQLLEPGDATYVEYFGQLLKRSVADKNLPSYFTLLVQKLFAARYPAMPHLTLLALEQAGTKGHYYSRQHYALFDDTNFLRHFDHTHVERLMALYKKTNDNVFFTAANYLKTAGEDVINE